MSATPPVVVLFGRPGSGKGTFAQLLVEQFGYQTCSTGAAMRAWSEGDSDEQRDLKASLARGEYGSDELAARIVGEFLATLPSGTPGVVLDGFPRNPAQLEAMLARPEFRSALMVAVKVDLSERLCRERLARRSLCPACQRTGSETICSACGSQTVRRPEDGDPDAASRRFEAYDELVRPTIAAWLATGLPLDRANNSDDGLNLRLWARYVAMVLAERRAA